MSCGQKNLIRPYHLILLFVVLVFTATMVWVVRELFRKTSADVSWNKTATPTTSGTDILQTAKVVMFTDLNLSTLVPTASLPQPTPTLVNTFTPFPVPTYTPTFLPASTYPLPVDMTEVEAILSGLTLEQKVGQMLMVGVPGPALDDLTRQRIIQQGVGGVIFLEQNGISPQQVRALTESLQATALEQGPGLPLFIGWNQEGGRVTRRGAGITQFPYAMALGATGNLTLAYAVGEAVGVEMHSLGVNMNFAPVLDVNSEPTNPVIGLRAFGNAPTMVARMGQQYIRGLQSAGVIGVAKHFPGHGDVTVDSHVDLPVLAASWQELQARELPPFEAALTANVGGVMVAHLQIPALDANRVPSSMSPNIVSALLRGQMGYNGVVMTDDMGMGAIVNYYSLTDAAVQAVLAGNDLLLTVETQTYPDEIQQAILSAVANGRLSETRIDESVRRLIQLKVAYNLANPPPLTILPDQAAHQALAFTVGAEAVQKVRDDGHWLPLNLLNNTVVLISPQEINPGEASGDGQSVVGEALANRGVIVQELFYNPADPYDIANVQTMALSHLAAVDAAIVITWDAALQFAQTGSTAQEQLVNVLLASGKPVIVAFSQLPYDAERLPLALTQIAMYGDSAGQAEGLVNWVLGSR